MANENKPEKAEKSKKRGSKKRRRAARRRRIRIAIGCAAAVTAIILLSVLLKPEPKPAEPPAPVEVYPVSYVGIIRAAAEENAIPPAYIAGVILAESGYDPEAVSYADARGLMQLLPSTAEWIAGKFDESYYEGCLFVPEINIRYGAWYLGFLMKRYDGNMRCASSAYHAGQGTVDKWLKDPAYSADGKTLDVIPSEATETYVQRVLRYYEKYDEIYAAPEPTREEV